MCLDFGVSLEPVHGVFFILHSDIFILFHFMLHVLHCHHESHNMNPFIILKRKKKKKILFSAMKRMTECLTTPQHENRSAIGCQNKVDA